MSPPLPLLLLILTTLLTPLTTASLCPSFTLTATAPNQEYNNQLLTQSGRSTYLSNTTPSPPDAIATFFRNDSTHLYATNFNISYISEFETGPFMLTILKDGGPLFDNDPVRNLEEWTPYTGTGFNVSRRGNDSFVGFRADEVGWATNDSSIGGWWVCYEEGPPGLPQVAKVNLGYAGAQQTYADEGCVKTLFRITDVNVTAAPFC